MPRISPIILLYAVIAMCACNTPRNNGHIAMTNDGEGTSLCDYGKEITPTLFATVLFDKICRSEKKENICISPASAAWTLSMLANGADGNTLAQITSTLGYDSILRLNQRQKELATIITSSDTSASTIIANSIWINKELSVKAPFVDSNQKYYNATTGNREFNNETLKEINNWCAEKTNGKIKTILSKLDKRTKMLLLNALYFKAMWSKPFDANATVKHPFTKENGDTITVDMMNQRLRTSYFENDIVQMASKPFGNGSFSMLFIMPKNNDIAATANAMIDNLDNWCTTMQEGTNVILGLPKFVTEYDTSLITALRNMGITDAFSHSADFSHISESPLYVDDIIQKSYIKVDEYGAEAAAVTIASMQLLSARPTENRTMIMDRPFIFAIRENITNENNILFIGKIDNPNNKKQ